MKIAIHQPLAIFHQGKRKNQEDALFPMPGEASKADRFFIVCDGMGGHEKGEVASQAVSKGLGAALRRIMADNTLLTDELFDEALACAYDTLDQADTQHEGKMGTTMTCVCLHRGGCLAAHIGDSRIYHLRPKTRQVLYRSRDHSLVQHLYEMGEISYNDMATSPRRNIILRVMQPYQQERTKATMVHITDLRPGDYLYLCSDGMLEDMDDPELLDILCSRDTDQEKMQTLISRTSQNADNHSAYLVRIDKVKHEPDDKQLVEDETQERARSKAMVDTHKDQAWNSQNEPQPEGRDLSVKNSLRSLRRWLPF